MSGDICVATLISQAGQAPKTPYPSGGLVGLTIVWQVQASTHWATQGLRTLEDFHVDAGERAEEIVLSETPTQGKLCCREQGKYIFGVLCAFGLRAVCWCGELGVWPSFCVGCYLETAPRTPPKSPQGLVAPWHKGGIGSRCWEACANSNFHNNCLA